MPAQCTATTLRLLRQANRNAQINLRLCCQLVPIYFYPIIGNNTSNLSESFYLHTLEAAELKLCLTCSNEFVRNCDGLPKYSRSLSLASFIHFHSLHITWDPEYPRPSPKSIPVPRFPIFLKKINLKSLITTKNNLLHLHHQRFELLCQISVVVECCWARSKFW